MNNHHQSSNSRASSSSSSHVRTNNPMVSTISYPTLPAYPTLLNPIVGQAVGQYDYPISHDPIPGQHPPTALDHHETFDRPSKTKTKRTVSRPLQRNQACSTCRSRKVRCDARKPACGACCRSAAAHGEDPNIVVCHYDTEEEVPLSTPTDQDRPLAQGEPQKLSVKIVSLRDKIARVEQLISEFEHHNSSTPITRNASSSSLSRDFSLNSFGSDPTSISDDSPSALLTTDWPKSLPPRSIVSHVVNLYLNHACGAGQTMFLARAHFQASLHLPPLDPGFPFVGLLHAIMALALQHCASAEPDQLMLNLLNAASTRRYWPMGQAVHHYHAECAKINIDEAIGASCYLLQAVQATAIFSAYAYNVGRLVETWVYSGLAIRFMSPLGLNCLEDCIAYETGEKPPPRILLPPLQSVTEKYERAATFWFGFQMDRFISASAGRAHAIEETDISSLLPARPGSSSATLALVRLVGHPLSLTHAHFFAVHPPDVDEWALELKATVLLGQVSSWLRQAPEPVGFNLRKYWDIPAVPVPDLRSQPTFVKLDQQILSFEMSLPRPMLDILTSERVSSRLMISILPSLATMLLHECFVTTTGTEDGAWVRCVGAAQKVVDLADRLLGSSIDLRRICPFVNFCWAVAARTLTRALVRSPWILSRGVEEVYVLVRAIGAQVEKSTLAQTYQDSVVKALENREKLYSRTVQLVELG